MKRFLLILFGIVLAGCEAQATPIAAIVTETNTPEPTAIPIPDLRYGIAGNIAPYIGDMGTIPFEILSADSAISDFDLVVAYGIYDGWEQAPHSHRVSLAINPNLAPLDNASISDLIHDVIDSQAIVDSLNIPGSQQTTELATVSANSIRTTLANAGYPDGFQLTMATENIPAVDVLASQFAVLSMDMRLIELSETVLVDNQAHLILFIWSHEGERAGWVSQVGEGNIIDLWTMPISYLNNSAVTVEFTENGIPIPAQ